MQQLPFELLGETNRWVFSFPQGQTAQDVG